MKLGIGASRLRAVLDDQKGVRQMMDPKSHLGIKIAAGRGYWVAKGWPLEEESNNRNSYPGHIMDLAITGTVRCRTRISFSPFPSSKDLFLHFTGLARAPLGYLLSAQVDTL